MKNYNSVGYWTWNRFIIQTSSAKLRTCRHQVETERDGMFQGLPEPCQEARQILYSRDNLSMNQWKKIEDSVQVRKSKAGRRSKKRFHFFNPKWCNDEISKICTHLVYKTHRKEARLFVRRHRRCAALATRARCKWVRAAGARGRTSGLGLGG